MRSLPSLGLSLYKYVHSLSSITLHHIHHPAYTTNHHTTSIRYTSFFKSLYMALVEVIHMNGGDGETSYAENSVIQRKLIDMAKPSRDSAVKGLYSVVFRAVRGKAAVGIAELGCSTGPNALAVAHEFIAAVDGLRRESGHDGFSPEYQVFLNDLPGNDFNTIFRAVPGLLHQLNTEIGPDFGSCFVNGVPGSFYGRLFPTNSLHFVHSSSSLHFLSQVPRGIERNRGKSAESVGKAYAEQFESDFSTFLKCRGEELVSGGCVVFTLHCRRDDLPPNNECSFASTWVFIFRALAEMVSEGLVEKEKLDTFHRPLYSPSWAEIQELVIKEGSFTVTNSNTFEVSNYSSGVDVSTAQGDERALHERRIRYIVTSTRTGMEPLLLNHFGEDLSIDKVFEKYEAISRECLTEELARLKMITVTLTKTN